MTRRPVASYRGPVVEPPGGTRSLVAPRALVPGALAETNEISQALNSGKHTTTATRWYWVDRTSGTALIDSPGFQEFGLHHIAPTQLAACMPDIAAHASDCRFYNCTHQHEPGCGVIAAQQAGQISASRYRIYGEILEELSRQRW